VVDKYISSGAGLFLGCKYFLTGKLRKHKGHASPGFMAPIEDQLWIRCPGVMNCLGISHLLALLRIV